LKAINLFWVFLGGGVGSLLRYYLGYIIVFGAGFPMATLFINLLGSALLGFLSGVAAQYMNTPMLLLLGVGFCGGFTTFSTFSIESVKLLEAGHLLWFVLYVAGSVVGGLILAFAAFYFARLYC
jgi:CrcB protein